MPTENEIQMLQAARAAGITTRDEMANFMGQMSHESGGFTRLEEGFRYTRGLAQISASVPSVLREGREAAEAARLDALEGRPQELARLMYGARMGNDDVGDGYFYRGRGYTQLTGEGNYRNAAVGVNLDLVNEPGLAADRDNAQRIALWYWESRVPQADRDDVYRATLEVNGGTNGLTDRYNRFDAWHAQLTPEFIADLDAGRVQAGVGVRPAVGRPAMEDGALRRLETGGEVRQLNDNLRALNIRDQNNRAVPVGETFGRETEQAIRRFQEQQSLPVTGRADPDTLQAVNRALERQQGLQPDTPNQANPNGPDAPHNGPPGREGRDRQDPRNPQQPVPPDQQQRPQPNGRGGGNAALLNDVVQRDNRELQQSSPIHPSSVEHPFHSLYSQATAHVQKEDERRGRAPDEYSERLALSATALAVENGITKIDHLVLSKENKERGVKAGENVVIVQGGFDDPAHNRADMKTEVAVNTPVEQSLRALDALYQRQAQEARSLAQQPTQNPGQDPNTPRGPKLT